jgi:hypothetical protein
MHPAKLLIIAGLVLVGIGGLWYFLGPGPFSRLGRLPGDINIRRDNWSLHIPIVTSILLSLLATLLLYLFRR